MGGRVIISFSVENWTSFRDRASLSMVAGRERQHGSRVPKLGISSPGRVLPVAAIYGGNASGKTNLFTALMFAQKLIVEGTQPDAEISVEPFLLDSESYKKPMRFSFEILVDKDIYAFSFAVTRRAVCEEKLVQIRSSSERVLYDRCDDNPNFHQSLEGNKDINMDLKYAFRATRENQLFLTNSVFQNIDYFKPVHDWFKETLVLISPHSRNLIPIDKKYPLYERINDLLLQFDTGVSSLGQKEVPIQQFPDFMTSRINERVSEDDNEVYVTIGSNAEHFIFTKMNGKLKAVKPMAHHKRSDGKEVLFEMTQESEGTLRLIDLLPPFLDVSSSDSNKVYVIDEIDRSLHTLLTRKLLQMYLNQCSSKSRSQLLLTTHDVLLMDQKLFRRDEMWLTERDHSGNSSLIHFGSYKDMRYDKDVRKSYLEGRLGGVPRFLTEDILG